MQSVMVLAGLIAIVWFIVWTVKTERQKPGEKPTGLFAYRDWEDYHKKYGDKQPF